MWSSTFSIFRLPSCFFRCSLAERLRIRFERAVVREYAARSDRRGAVEPGEERQLLEMVCETVGHGHRRNIDAGQRITNFKVVLAASHLSDVSPGWSRIGAQRIIHPFTNFMGHDSGISNRRAKNPACVEVYRRVGLGGEAKRAVVAENTAFLKEARRTNRHHHIVEEKDRKGGGVDSLGSELRDDGARHKWVPPVDVDYAGEAA